MCGNNVFSTRFRVFFKFAVICAFHRRHNIFNEPGCFPVDSASSPVFNPLMIFIENLQTNNRFSFIFCYLFCRKTHPLFERSLIHRKTTLFTGKHLYYGAWRRRQAPTPALGASARRQRWRQAPALGGASGRQRSGVDGAESQ